MNAETPNPCAFPFEDRLGMSLRDYFAAAALQGIIASPAFFGSQFQGNIEGAAGFAYACADLMLKERAK